ncbi:MAG: hypothetical protein A2283_21320 [Lentisphaerae bacterium RIFOXYA12_FULL_48_11]|nr:MAG: hypothetical protein A2283_21320 [Lentisphaerae bacterium RIFOXYA12_FULL_48_11]
MNDEAVSLARGVADPAKRMNILREYLQALILRSLHESEAFKCLAFVGGTALRFLYQLPRFSEGLDFSLVKSSGYAPAEWMTKVKRDLSLAGFDPLVSLNDRKTVHVAWIKIAAILQESGLAAMSDQKLSIKLEIDTKPPKGGVTLNQVVEKHRMFVVRHHDQPSLMAGKLHALITRKYPKGRDWYDFVWYRAVRPPITPNLVLLQNALDQTHGKGVLSAADWPGHMTRKIATLAMARIRGDVEPFLERSDDADLITKENILGLLPHSSTT